MRVTIDSSFYLFKKSVIMDSKTIEVRREDVKKDTDHE